MKYERFENISEGNFVKLAWDDIEGFEQDNLKEAYKVFALGCEKSSKKDLLESTCQKIKGYQNPISFFKKNFEPYKLYDSNNNDKGIITGYYEPLLRGSRVKTEKYKYPIFSIPKDFIIVDLDDIYPELKSYRLRGKLDGNRLVPYDTREQIKEDENKEVIVYVDDKIDLYFLHIQGSGKVQLETGEIINVGFANQNGQRYDSIGKYMMKKKLLESYGASMQGMRAWFEDNPKKTDDVLNINKSYIFFHESENSATGSLGVPLVKERNLAVDIKYIPLGLPVFINTKNPVTKEKIAKLMVAADTGGAIKGEIRADFYWGYGKEAGEMAGKMKEDGSLIVFLPKDKIK